MYQDAHALFSSAQDITSAAASTNLMDLGTGRRIGTGQDLYIVVQVETAFTDASSNSTLAVIVQQDTAAAFSSPTTIQTIGTFAALSAAGTELKVKLQPETQTERFIRLYYTPANGNFTTCGINAFMTTDIDAFTAYPNNYTISP